ncbi:MAG: acyl-CoA thioesterase [Polyangiaceae bacterium]|nr:acyl-CoA thioesterase [Myxococcales bacterium]MCB9587808.1 acyl-CoA thioesterase [Polyangiaceae bacterium]MCB9608757.1 acyl-CoA thioesterase [Polyangiaceae bacterium]
MSQPYRFDLQRLRQLEIAPGAFRVKRAVRFHDIDAAGIVYFARVLDYAHDTYCQYLESVGHGLPQVLSDGEWAAPIGHVEVDYFAPLLFGDELELVIARAHLDGSRLTLAHLVRCKDKVRCVVQTTHVFVGRADFRPIAIPPSLLEALQQLPRG